MSQIKYGEIIVIHNLNNILTNLYFLFGYNEQYVSEESTIIIKFDQEIYDSNNKVYNFNFRYNYENTYLPSSFKSLNKHIYFIKKCTIYNDISNVNFINLFKQFQKYDINNNVPSYFNGVYFRHQTVNDKISKINKFGIVRLKSSALPMYQFAYDSDEFSKHQIIYIINTIFRRNNNTNLL